MSNFKACGWVEGACSNMLVQKLGCDYDVAKVFQKSLVVIASERGGY